jgi:hypothetical protein
VRTLRSTDYGLSWGSPANISTVAHPPGVAYANEDTFTGPGGGVQIQSGKHAGRLVVPSIATYTNASAASCPVASACWTSATHDHALYSDDGGSSWLSGTPSGGIAGCGKKDGAQCGDEFQVVELSGGGVLGVSRHNGMLAFSSFTKDLRVSRKVAVFVVFNLTCMNTNEFWQAGPRSP